MWTTLWNQGLPPLQWGVVIGASLAAALFDAAWRRIPNLLTGPLVASGLAWSGIAAGWAGVTDAALAMVLLALPYVLLFLFAGGGAGDAKLMGAIGAWLGLVNGMAVLLCVAGAGIVLGVAFAAARKQLGGALRNVALAVVGMAFALAGRSGRAGWHAAIVQVPDRGKMPYGLAVFVGVCLAAGGVVLWKS